MRVSPVCLWALLIANLLFLPTASLAGDGTPQLAPLPPSVFLKDYSGEPANDVQVFYTGNGTPVVKDGNWLFSSWTPEVDLVGLHSQALDDPVTEVKVWAELKGDLPQPMWDNISFVFRLYTDDDDLVHYIVNYSGPDGEMWLSSNSTSFTPVEITGNATIHGGSNPSRTNIMEVRIALALIPEVTAWEVDASSQEVGSVYTYRDFVYQVPGHPGTSPAMIGGRVYEVDGTTPIAGVNVSTDVGGYYTTTDADGAYQLFMAPGNYNITARKDGYQDSTQQKAMGSGEIATLDFRLQPAGFLERLGPWGLVGLLALVAAVVTVAALLLLRRRETM
jgi:hypothetical protein